MAKIAGSLLVMVTIVVGCTASSVISEDKIRNSTAGTLGVKPDQLTIETTTSDVTTTYYIARTTDGGEYACSISGGVLSAGLTNPPQCTKKK
jgi:hypothetical protein